MHTQERTVSDKQLTEQEWKKFAKGKNLKDAALVKAMAELDKAKAPDAQLEALAEIEKQADLLRKANKADKDITAYLDDIDKALGKERKLAEAEAKKAAAQESSESEDEEEPAQLAVRMVPLMKAVAKGEVLHAMIATEGKEAAVMVSRKSLGAPQRKLLTTALGTTSGVKFIAGECIWEANAHTFVVQSAAAGLARKLREALFKQTQQRFKVRVRGEDPNDVDEDGEPAPQDELEAGESEGEQGGEPQATQAQDHAAEFEQALDGWRIARTAAITVLKALAREAAELRDPESAKAVIEVQAVVKQLSAEPRSAQQVAQLMQWVSEDEVVIDVCNLEQDIRTPLLNALSAMQKTVPAN